MDEQFIYNIVKNGEKQNYVEMKNLITNTPQNIILETVKCSIKTDNAINFWNYLLSGFALCSNIEGCNQRRFECAEMLLNQLSKTDLPYKKAYDLITRLCSELSLFQSHQLLTMVDICFNSIKFGDKNSIWWKDIFPELLVLLSDLLDLNVTGVRMNGLEYKNQMVKSILSLEFTLSTLTPLANMFVDFKLEENDLVFALKKFCKYLPKLSPAELPPLAYQLFYICQTASQLIIPLLSLEKYFNHFYYNKLIMDLDSDSSCLDSIDSFSEKEICEAEETILHHLSFCTRFRISEEQVQAAFQNIVFSPEIILKPFILSAIISMSQANRDSNCFILSSPLLKLLKSTIKKNEEQLDLLKYSIWIENTSQTRVQNMEQIFSLLIDKNKEGKDIITPGLVNLAFVLLKAKNCKKLNLLGTTFLAQFIKKRFVFSYGIVKNLTDWMIAEQNSEQYSDCLTILSHSDSFTISESFKSIKNILDFFLWIPGKNAMRMMSFIMPLIKISQPIRDAFIDIMKKAINSRDNETCHMGVYGFICLLKQLNNNNSQRSNIMGTPFMATQQCISGYSLMTQSNLSNRLNSQRHFDILVLEIIGCLRKCFTASLEIKETLYENLCRSVFLNSKLAPHFLEFIESYFRGYFKIDESETIIYFDKIVYKEDDTNTIRISDNIGLLTVLVSSIILVCEKNEIAHNSVIIKTIINTVIDRINSKDFKLIPAQNFSSVIEYYILIQKKNLLEALMYYLLWTSRKTNINITKISLLFEEHQKITNIIQDWEKKQKNVKSRFEKNEASAKNILNNKKMLKNGKMYKNIWDLPTLERFLKLLFDDIVSFAHIPSVTNLKSNLNFVRYILKTTADYLEDLQYQPNYKQIKLSTRLFKQICAVTKIIYNRCIKNLSKLWQNFDPTSAYFSVECLKQSFLTIQKFYDKKFEQYMKEIDPLILPEKKEIYQVIQIVFEEALKDEESCHEKIPEILLCCLDVLYKFILAGTSLALESFDWLYDICQRYEISVETTLIYKLLFTMRLKTRSGSFFESIAIHLGKLIGVISKAESPIPQFDFKALTLSSSIPCYFLLIDSMRQQLEFTDFFISKVKASLYNIKFFFESDQDVYKINLKTMERSICTQFTHIANSLIQITNVNLPLGENTDSLIRLLAQFYILITNLTKHLMLRHPQIPVCFSSIKFDQVVRLAGKPLASQIYALILNIDEKIVCSMNKSKKKNPEADQAKVLKETKYLPKLILRIENFNKFVIFLSKKTGKDLTHFLHIGTVRDFRIQTKSLKKAIDDSLAHNSQIQEENISEINNEELNFDKSEASIKESCDENLEKEREELPIKVKTKNKRKKSQSGTKTSKKAHISNGNCSQIDNLQILNENIQDKNDYSSMEETPMMGVLDEEENCENAGLQFLQNVVKVSEKGMKRNKINSKVITMEI